jgi:hypothetical protein
MSCRFRGPGAAAPGSQPAAVSFPQDAGVSRPGHAGNVSGNKMTAAALSLQEDILLHVHAGNDIQQFLCLERFLINN